MRPFADDLRFERPRPGTTLHDMRRQQQADREAWESLKAQMLVHEAKRRASLEAAAGTRTIRIIDRRKP